MCIIPEKEWVKSWEDTLQCEWPCLHMPDTEYRVVGVEVVTTHWWLLPHIPYDKVRRPHPIIQGVTCWRDSIDGRTLDAVRFACPYDYTTVVAVVRELVGLGLTPTDRWSLVLLSMLEPVDQS